MATRKITPECLCVRKVAVVGEWVKGEAEEHKGDSEAVLELYFRNVYSKINKVKVF